ncbi:hypothetical protein GCM10011419_27680 [Vogesella fluminis]|uniref:Uncharacterized protein n=1 Tax=Vogesella fluminis TaxID=1069161 RepID=A0ABQ3HDN6_9NEIS|nr:hypothetical protein GCM10011419_27680 [Vogesella fluminis]
MQSGYSLRTGGLYAMVVRASRLAAMLAANPGPDQPSCEVQCGQRVAFSGMLDRQ